MFLVVTWAKTWFLSSNRTARVYMSLSFLLFSETYTRFVLPGTERDWLGLLSPFSDCPRIEIPNESVILFVRSGTKGDVLSNGRSLRVD